MGKSHKKVKNDRINAIRKQYDAFLEEDKKRRERNEYILGQLDKMRSTTALVPFPAKANNYHKKLNPSENYIRPNSLTPRAVLGDTYVTQLKKHNDTSGLLNTPVEELHVLKEISKKYILIPKRVKPIENELIYRKDIDDDDDDWKTKYNILDDLKKLEKEGESDPIYNRYKDNNNMQNKRPDLSMDTNTSGTPPPHISNHPNNFNMSIPEKLEELTETKNDSYIEKDKNNKQVNFNVSDINDRAGGEESKNCLQIASVTSDKGITEDQQQPTHNVIQECISNPQQEAVIENEKYDTESSEKDLNSITLNKNAQISQLTHNHRTVYEANDTIPDCNISMVETNKHTAPENIKADTAYAVTSDQTISQEKSQEPDNVAQKVHLDENIQNEKDTSEIRDLTSTERVELYDDVDPEGQIVANETIVEKPHDYKPTQNTTPDELENIQQPEHVEHESEINAFETEQKEMFYSEQSHSDAYGYNQGEDNTGEYPQGYEQNDQYGYYEGVQQQQAYATNINEHEESTERYDPHYNEQYEGSYGHQQPDTTVSYENTNEYEQQQFQVENHQYGNIENYENQQENAHLYQQEPVSNVNEVQENVLSQDDEMYDQNLYAETPVTQEHIEQQLIAEEGYTEISPVTTDEFQKETEGEIENVLETIAPEEPALEPKLA